MGVVVSGTVVNSGTASSPTIASTADWLLDADEIIAAAMRRVGGEQTKGYEVKAGREALHFVIQDITQEGINLWTVEHKTLSLVKDQTDPYVLAKDTIDVLEAVYRDTTQTTVSDIPVQRIARDEYHSLPDKATSGAPIQFYLERRRDAPALYVWPIPEKTGYEFRYYRIRAMRDVTNLVDNVDAPQRWMPTFVAGVAFYMALDRADTIGTERIDWMRRIYADAFERAAAEDRDRSNFTVEVDLSAYARI